jgi:hypothetical protein
MSRWEPHVLVPAQWQHLNVSYIKLSSGHCAPLEAQGITHSAGYDVLYCYRTGTVLYCTTSGLAISEKIYHQQYSY